MLHHSIYTTKLDDKNQVVNLPRRGSKLWQAEQLEGDFGTSARRNGEGQTEDGEMETGRKNTLVVAFLNDMYTVMFTNLAEDSPFLILFPMGA